MGGAQGNKTKESEWLHYSSSRISIEQ